MKNEEKLNFAEIKQATVSLGPVISPDLIEGVRLLKEEEEKARKEAEATSLAKKHYQSSQKEFGEKLLLLLNNK